jgi:cellobiose dehydrogenase (acceptor)
MVGPLLLVSYPNGPGFTNSVRIATRKSNPWQSTDGYKITPIASGSHTNDTHWVSTFLCAGCMGNSKSFQAADAQGKFGWAVGRNPVPKPNDANSSLTMHSGAQGVNIVVDLAIAKSAKYESWAAMAKDS